LADDETVDCPAAEKPPVGWRTVSTVRLATNSKMKQACKGRTTRAKDPGSSASHRLPGRPAAQPCEPDGVEDSSAPKPAEAVERVKGPASLPVATSSTIIAREATMEFETRTPFCSLAMRCGAQSRHRRCTTTDRLVLWLRAGGYLPDLDRPSVRRYIAISKWDPKIIALGRGDVIIADTAGGRQRDEEPH
jgi:hypothetical protein